MYMYTTYIKCTHTHTHINIIVYIYMLNETYVSAYVRACVRRSLKPDNNNNQIKNILLQVVLHNDWLY